MMQATTHARSEFRSLAQRMKFTGFTALLMLLLGSPFVLRAQDTTGTIAGNVTDSSGAAVVGATVTSTNTLTNTVRSTVTDSAGQYTLPSLPAGTYSLDVEMTGFQGQRTNSIVLDAGQSARQDFKMVVGKVNETVTIQAGAAAALLQTENATVGGVIDGKKIVDLPLNGRDFIQLAQLIPGANAGAAIDTCITNVLYYPCCSEVNYPTAGQSRGVAAQAGACRHTVGTGTYSGRSGPGRGCRSA